MDVETLSKELGGMTVDNFRALYNQDRGAPLLKLGYEICEQVRGRRPEDPHIKELLGYVTTILSIPEPSEALKCKHRQAFESAWGKCGESRLLPAYRTIARNQFDPSFGSKMMHSLRVWGDCLAEGYGIKKVPLQVREFANNGGAGSGTSFVTRSVLDEKMKAEIIGIFAHPQEMSSVNFVKYFMFVQLLSHEMAHCHQFNLTNKSLKKEHDFYGDREWLRLNWLAKAHTSLQRIVTHKECDSQFSEHDAIFAQYYTETQLKDLFPGIKAWIEENSFPDAMTTVDIPN